LEGEGAGGGEVESGGSLLGAGSLLGGGVMFEDRDGLGGGLELVCAKEGEEEEEGGGGVLE